MLSSAVSALSLLLVAAPQSAQQSSNLVWQAVNPSVIFIQGRNGVSGVAALIVLNHDRHTQLTLLQATYWDQGTRKVIKVASKSTTHDDALLAVTQAGPQVGEFIAAGKAGMMKPSLRYVPLSEVRFASNVEKLGGAMVFDNSGDLIGVLGATLVSSQRSSSSFDNLRTGFSQSDTSQGPRNITVAYALGREVLVRVVAGFKSRTRQVQHPTIGLFFKANPGGRGVLVDSVLTGSPSWKAGLKSGDVVLDVNGVSVNSPVELAVLLFRQEIGDTILVRFMRGSLKRTTNVKVVSSQSTLGL